MTEKREQIIQTVQPAKTEDELRLLPFLVAGLVCFTIAVVLGTGSWFVFGSRNRQKSIASAETSLPPVSDKKDATAKTENTNIAIPESSPTNPAATEKTAIEGVVDVEGGEIALGGGDTKMPLERAVVKEFSIAETEVTNAQYSEFVKETNHAAPAGWKESTFPKGTENYPVTNVSWQDANAFCEWMTKKLGLPVRLPTEAEWEMAARGRDGSKYPWGNEWKKEAANSEETGGKVSAVKSFPLNRSPFGAFDMAGNVWEWTQDKVSKNEEVTDARVKEALENGRTLRIVKGGSAFEKSNLISAQSRYEIPDSTKDVWVGFRYVVEKKQNP